MLPALCPLKVNLPALHDEADLFHGLHAFKRIPGKGDDIGVFTRFQGPYVRLPSSSAA